MKKTLLLLPLLALPLSAQTLLYQWQFDGSGTAAASTVPGGGVADLSLASGAVHGSANSGVNATGKALDNSASASMGGNGGIASAVNFDSSTLPNSGSLGSFTITTWIRPAAIVSGGFGRIFIFGPNGISDSGTANSVGLLTSSNSGGGLEFNIGGFQRTANLLPTVDEWTFLAVSYNDASNTVVFYSGNETTGVSAHTTFTDFSQGAPDLNAAGSTSSVFIGNRSNGQRAFDGGIDDTRFYSGLFADAAALDAVRVAAIPEPGTLGLVSLSLLVCLGLFRRRR